MRLRRSYDLHQNLTIMLVCAVATVVLTRAFLAATGYPQVGGSKFHIAHVLYGGLLLTLSLIAAVGLLSPAARPLASVFGGVGFGLFIDEVGKFVTKDVNYFYKPAIAIIYVCFLVLFGIVRWLARRNFTSDERVLIGFDALQRAAVGSLSRERRGHVLALLAGVDTPMAREVTGLLERSAAEPERETVGRRVRVVLRHAWHEAAEHPRFRQLVLAVLGVAVLLSAFEIAWFLRNGIHPLPGGERAFLVVTVVADAVALLGALALRRSLLCALHWYDHALLLEITVGQVFLYASQQLAASLNLLALLVLWALVRGAIHFESAPSGLWGSSEEPQRTMSVTPC